MLILWCIKFSNLRLKTCVPTILKSLKSLKRTQLSSAHNQLSTVYKVDSTQFNKHFLAHENRPTAMRLNTLLPAQIYQTPHLLRQPLTEALCMYLPVIADEV